MHGIVVNGSLWHSDSPEGRLNISKRVSAQIITGTRRPISLSFESARSTLNPCLRDHGTGREPGEI